MATDVQSQLSRWRYGDNGDSQYGTHGFLILSPQSDVKGHTLAIGAHAQNENARLCSLVGCTLARAGHAQAPPYDKLPAAFISRVSERVRP